MSSLIEMFPFVREHYEREGGVTAECVSLELSRFFELTMFTSKPLAMTSPKMDLMWHCFIQFTEVYTPYCQSKYGEVIHHRPFTTEWPVASAAIRNFYSLYEERFGNLPKLWADDVPSQITAFAQKKQSDIDPVTRWSGWPGRSAR